MMLRISAQPFSVPLLTRIQVYQMPDVALIQAAGRAAIALERTGDISDLERAVLEEFAKRFERMKGAMNAD